MLQSVYDIDEIRPQHVRMFLLELQEKGLKGITRHRYYRTIKTLCLFLQREEFCVSDFIKNVKPPIEEKKPMRIFSLEELHKILHSFDRTTFCGQRNYTIALMFFSCGIRLAELLNLKTVDSNMNAETIFVNLGKGQKTRVLPMSRTLKKVLREYLHMRSVQFDNCLQSWLFLSQQGNKFSRGGLHTVFQHVKKSLNIPGDKVNPHAFRHFFATYYLRGGGDVFTLQRVLGHAELEMTKSIF